MERDEGEVWRMADGDRRRRLNLGLAALWTCLGALSLASGSRPLGVLQVALGVLCAVLAAKDLRPRVELDRHGLRYRHLLRSVHVPWEDVADVRGNAGAWSEHLVLERRDGRVVTLPPGLPAELVERWRRGG